MLMMAIAIVWFVAALTVDRLAIGAIILFVAGLAGLARALPWGGSS